MLCAPMRLQPGRIIALAPIHTSPAITKGSEGTSSPSPINLSGSANECAPPLNKHILTHQQTVMHNQFAAMQAEILADTHIITYTDSLAVADIGSLLHIDRLTAFCKEVARAEITQTVCHLTNEGERGLGQVASHPIIEKKIESSHRF